MCESTQIESVGCIRTEGQSAADEGKFLQKVADSARAHGLKELVVLEQTERSSKRE